MKLKWFDRLLLTLVLLIFIGVSIFVIGIGFGPLRSVVENFYALMTNGLFINSLILVVVGIVLVLIALRVIVALCARKAPAAPTTVLLKTTDSGSIRIAISAVDSMVQRAARNAPSVRDVTSRVITTANEELAIQLRITFAPDTELASATVKVQEEVRDYVQKHTGVPVQEVQVYVQAVGNAAQAAKVA